MSVTLRASARGPETWFHRDKEREPSVLKNNLLSDCHHAQYNWIQAHQNSVFTKGSAALGFKRHDQMYCKKTSLHPKISLLRYMVIQLDLSVVCIVFLQGGDSYMCIFVERNIICNHGWILSVFTIGWKMFQREEKNNSAPQSRRWALDLGRIPF